ncbi:MAG TPA: CPBP family intramembrane metalloprotease [Candidatus Faecousia intestinigallinarum]|nr:CPBP family intramembrane metalloprotease [Candidatus Faecousia intestinigallinarum]
MKKLPISLTRRELLAGWCYLGLELFVLPYLLPLANALLPSPLSLGKLNFLFFSLNFLVLAVVFRRFLQASWRYARQHGKALLSAAALGFAVYLAAAGLVALALARVAPEFSNANDVSIAAMAREDALLMGIGTVLLVPMAEEILYRAVLFGSLYARNPMGAYVVSCLVFCAIHVLGYVGAYPAGMLLLSCLQYLPAGLCLAWVYVRSGSIFAPAIIHMLVNLSAFLMLL